MYLLKTDSHIKKFLKKIKNFFKFNKESINDSFNNKNNDENIDENIDLNKKTNISNFNENIEIKIDNKSNITENIDEIKQINYEEPKIFKESTINNIIKEKEIKFDIQDEDSKRNIKLLCKKLNKTELSTKKTVDPYPNSKIDLKDKYKKEPNNTLYKININNVLCQSPIFNLRKYDDIDFYFNFIMHNYDTKKIQHLNMCKDIHKWMSSSSLSNEDLPDELAPIYFIIKTSNGVGVYEYLKCFTHTSDDNSRNGFIQKGADYLIIKDYIDKLVENNYIKDLLDGKNYTIYNLSSNDDTVEFLERFMSLVLTPEQFIGQEITLDIGNYYENYNFYDYYLNTINSELSMFNTTI
jgi:hypothetical protein